jgi:hypothetical protein
MEGSLQTLVQIILAHDDSRVHSKAPGSAGLSVLFHTQRLGDHSNLLIPGSHPSVSDWWMLLRQKRLFITFRRQVVQFSNLRPHH